MKRFLKTLYLVFVFVMMFSMSVFATETGGGGSNTNTVFKDSGDAVQDILQDGRFQGAMSSIRGITDFIDIWFIRIISVVAFFIISAALLKNVCAGAYCANSKFWNKVHEAHQKTEAISIASMKGFFGNGAQGLQNTTVGGVKDFLLGIIPDIKAFTDFEDAEMEPKAYFMKAIPQMIACVIIGIFIYNGYYRDTAAKVGDMGSILIDRTLASVNPESLINSVFNMTSWPPFPWEEDESVEGKTKLAVAEELKSIVISNFNDIDEATEKEQVVLKITEAIQNKLPSGDSEYSPGEEGYIFKVSNVSGYASTPIEIEEGGFSSGQGDVNYKYVFPLNDLVTSTTELDATKVAYISFTLKRESSSESIQAGSNKTISTQNKEQIFASLNLTPALIKIPVNGVEGMGGGKYKFTNYSVPLTAFGLTAEQISAVDIYLMENGVNLVNGTEIKFNVPGGLQADSNGIINVGKISAPSSTYEDVYLQLQLVTQ